MSKRDLIRTLVLIVTIILVTVGSSLLLNIHTSEVFEQKQAERDEKEAQRKLGVLKEVLPAATNFTEITADITLDDAKLVQKVYKSDNGVGYVFIAQKKGDLAEMKDVVVVTVGVDMDGKIVGIQAKLANSADYKADSAANSLLGNDSNLSGYIPTSGATYTSGAIKDSVSAGFKVLTDNKLLKAAKKTAEVIFEENLSTVVADFVKGNDLTASGNVYKAYKSMDGNTVVCYVNKGEDKLLAINNGTTTKVYQPEVISEEEQTYKLVEVSAEVAAEVSTEVVKYLEDLKLAVLKEVLPTAVSFEEITSTLTITDTGVQSVYKDTAGAGYVLIVTKAGYGDRPVVITLGVDSEGKIAGISTEVSAGDWSVEESVENSYVGQDSTLSGVISGKATYSEKAVKNGVNAALNTLSENGLVRAAVKTVDQVYDELVFDVFSGLVKGTDLTATGNIYKAYQSLNKSGVVAYVNKGEDKLLAIYNTFGVTTVYKANCLNEFSQKYELLDVTSDNADVVEEVSQLAASKVTSEYTKLENKVTAYTEFSGAENFQELTIDVHNTVVAALSFTYEGNTYYAYLAKTYSFDNHIMEVCVVVDSEGKIAKVNSSQFFFEEEYFFTQPSFDKVTYEGNLNGLTNETFDGSQTLVTNATMSSNAVKQAINDAFATYSSQGGNE